MIQWLVWAIPFISLVVSGVSFELETTCRHADDLQCAYHLVMENGYTTTIGMFVPEGDGIPTSGARICSNDGVVCITRIGLGDTQWTFYLEYANQRVGPYTVNAKWKEHYCDVGWGIFPDDCADYYVSDQRYGSSSPPPANACDAAHFGSGDGRGSAGDCCETNDDCNSQYVCASNHQCVSGQHPSGNVCNTAHFGTGDGQGGVGDCCESNDDCRDSCQSNHQCNAATGPPSSCDDSYYGTGNRKGGDGDCCETVEDCDCDHICVVGNVCKEGQRLGGCNGGSSSCTSGYSGSGNGQGPNGACCTSSDDCQDTCSSGRCSGASTLPTSTPSSCLSGYAGKGNGQGPTCACCKSSNDCLDTCNSDGTCGASGASCNLPSKTTTTTTTTKATPTSCVTGYYGKGSGQGPTCACCASNNDCLDTCNSDGTCGVSGASCNLPSKTTTTTTTTKATPTSCVTGYYGKSNGQGPTCACCASDNDCLDTCNSDGTCGVSGSSCNLPSTTASTTTTTTTPMPMPTSVTGCLSRSSLGLQLQDGPTGACCISDLDCVLEDMCIDGTCTSYYYDPELYEDCSDSPQYVSTTTIIQTATVTLGDGSGAAFQTPFALPFPAAPPFCFLCFAGVGGGAGPGGVACFTNNDCRSNNCDNNLCAIDTISSTSTTPTSTTSEATITIAPTNATSSTSITITPTNNATSSTTITIAPTNTTSSTSITIAPTSTTITIAPTNTTSSTSITIAPTSTTSSPNNSTLTTINATLTSYYTFTTYVNATSPTPTATPCSCVTGYSNTGNGKGPTGACCKASNDCLDTCNKDGVCGVSGVLYSCTGITSSSSTTTTKSTSTTSSSSTTTTKSTSTTSSRSTTTTKSTSTTSSSSTTSSASSTPTCGGSSSCTTDNDCSGNKCCDSNGQCNSNLDYCPSNGGRCPSGSCTGKYAGSGSGKGTSGNCCDTDNDCQSTCLSGVCGGS